MTESTVETIKSQISLRALIRKPFSQVITSCRCFDGKIFLNVIFTRIFHLNKNTKQKIGIKRGIRK